MKNEEAKRRAEAKLLAKKEAAVSEATVRQTGEVRGTGDLEGLLLPSPPTNQVVQNIFGLKTPRIHSQ